MVFLFFHTDVPIHFRAWNDRRVIFQVSVYKAGKPENENGKKKIVTPALSEVKFIVFYFAILSFFMWMERLNKKSLP
jgi:hypothetical protein